MEPCKLCNGGKSEVKDRGVVIICPMCNGKKVVSKEDIEAFFEKLMKRKSMYYYE